jgi:hypothetical protein
LEVPRGKNIDCLIIYSKKECESDFKKEDHYVNFYKLVISLPELKI